MEENQISSIVKDTITKADLKKLSPWRSTDFWKDQLCALVSPIPIVGGIISSEIQAISDYKASEFFRKFTAYVYGLEGTSLNDRVTFACEVDQKANDIAEYVLTGIVSRMDNINKEFILANLTKAKIFGKISIEDFFRLSSILERIPYVDLPLLKQYVKDYYDESGDTELLAATGVIKQTVVGDNMYALSELGIKLIRFGLKEEVIMESSHSGTQVDLQWADESSFATKEDIVNLLEEKEQHNKEDKERDDDSGAFYYDLARGK